jgi:hypothetical protein
MLVGVWMPQAALQRSTKWPQRDPRAGAVYFGQYFEK